MDGPIPPGGTEAPQRVASAVMDLGIAGKVALVTAASKGLGRGAALALAREGCRVAICAREAGSLEATAAELGPDTLTIAADVAEGEAPARLAAATIERFGGLDIVVANAGGPPKGRAFEIDDETILAAVQANLLASIRLTRAAVPTMREAGWGRIVLLTSIAVLEPIPDLAASNIARAGLWAWARTAARDLADDGITLNLVCPGLHATDRVRELGAGGRLGDPEDLGRLVAFLCSTSASFISGAAIPVDGAA
jgi:3-oxoacyl-[acyl-carrier protein] reductase